MRLTFELGRWVGRIWASRQLKRNAWWFHQRHPVQCSVQMWPSRIGDDGQIHPYLRDIAITFTCQGEVVSWTEFGSFTRHGRRTLPANISEMAAEIAACDGQYLSDYDLDCMRLWDWWYRLCGACSAWRSQFDSTFFAPLRSRRLRARRLVYMYPDQAFFPDFTAWLSDYCIQHGSVWPEDQPGWYERIARERDRARELTAWHRQHPIADFVGNRIDDFLDK